MTRSRAAAISTHDERRNPMPSISTRAAAVALLVASALLTAACGSTATTTPAQTGIAPTSPPQTGDAPEQTPVPLDCDLLMYPCLLSDVPQEIRSRSEDLARQAGKRVSDGGSFEDAAAWLRGQSGMAEVGVDDGAIRFRLDGGRPTWVLDPGDAGSAAAATQTSRPGLAAAVPWGIGVSARPALAAPRRGTRQGGPTLANVVSQGSAEKSAVVLAPFAWLDANMRAKTVADILEPVRGYAGRVRYLENTSLEADQVTIQSFLELADVSVIYLKSFGGKVCDAPDDCTTTVAVEAFLDPSRHLSDVGLGSELDIIIFAGVDWEAFGVGADFFRAHYPGGLQRALVFFDAGALGDEKLTRSVKGASSEYYYWDKTHQRDTVQVVAPFIERLAVSGLAPGIVFEQMKDELVLGEAKLIGITPIGFGGQRIREIVTLRDKEGADLVDGGSFAIDGHMGDGEADTLHVVVGVDGITAEEAGQTVVSLRVDGEPKSEQLVEEGTDFGDGSWGLSFDVEVPDVRNGQEITLEAVASLMEHGTSFHAVTVVAGVALGTQWEGHVSRESDVFFPGVKIRLDTDVTFVRDPDSLPSDRRVKFFVAAGSATWRIEGSYGSCTWKAGPVNIPLRVLEPVDYIQFDLADAGDGLITYSGEVSIVDGDMVEGTKTCDGKVETFRTRAEGVVWLAPQDEEFRLVSSRITDSWIRGSVMDSAYSWEFERTH
jgi:hypothetical protein